MDTIENLIITIVKPLSWPDAFNHPRSKNAPEFLEYHLDLDPSDVGCVIGRVAPFCDKRTLSTVPAEDKKVRIVIIDEK